MQLGGGALALAVGADLHRDTTQDERLPIVNTVTYANAAAARGQGARNVSALYAELDIPVTKTLTFNLAARDDYFSDFGNTFNPKASFRYEPMKTLMFRGSANTGFRAPTLFDRYGYRTAGANGRPPAAGTIRCCARAARRALPAPAPRRRAASPPKCATPSCRKPGRQQPRTAA